MDTRKSIFRPFQTQPETPVLGNPLFRHIQFGHDLDTADDLLVVYDVQRIHRPLQDPIDAVLDENFFVAGLDMDVRCAPVESVIDGGVDEPDDGARGVGEPVDGEGFFSTVILADDLHLQAFGSFLQDTLSALALLQ